MSPFLCFVPNIFVFECCYPSLWRPCMTLSPFALSPSQKHHLLILDFCYGAETVKADVWAGTLRSKHFLLKGVIFKFALCVASNDNLSQEGASIVPDFLASFTGSTCTLSAPAPFGHTHLVECSPFGHLPRDNSAPSTDLAPQ